MYLPEINLDTIKDDNDFIEIDRGASRKKQHVLIYKHKMLIKHYFISKRGKDKGDKHSLVIEHKALKKLHGLNTPKTFGYTVNKNDENYNVYTLYKEYIAGNIVKDTNKKFLESASKLIADFHIQKVITNDPKLENFIYDKQGELYFFDFSRARVFLWQGLFFFNYAAKDIVKVYRYICEDNEKTFEQFYELYLSHLKIHPFKRAMIRANVRSSLKAYKLKRIIKS